MYAMGEAMIAEQPEIGEVRFSLPNKHHFVIDLSPFGLDNPNEVFHADDRPYGLIEGTVHNDDAPEPGLGVRSGPGLVTAMTHDSNPSGRPAITAVSPREASCR